MYLLKTMYRWRNQTIWLLWASVMALRAAPSPPSPTSWLMKSRAAGWALSPWPTARAQAARVAKTSAAERYLRARPTVVSVYRSTGLAQPGLPRTRAAAKARAPW
ncbi:hypothetical protein OCS_05627 [Ophiocordyceps sinensis CO18]|uniref:Secreted protein n=1 Tax=Ophiocordyceps sinensis (strain Co18 / CGMCC 3.14243) TaxID=911162 RepID=T4ZZV8_OPHSC|nr:hypothetical protein OCS_05627 [Ophiocordyceps sinensis CO18]